MSVQPSNIIGEIFGTQKVLEYCDPNTKKWLVQCLNCGVVSQHKRSNLKTCKNCLGLAKGIDGLKKLYKQYSNKAVINNIDFLLDIETFKNMTSLPCFYCGLPPSQIMQGQKSDWGNYFYNEIYRKDNNVGYVEENCVPCCFLCNSAKGKMQHSDFFEWINRLAKFQSPKIVPKIFVLCGMIASGKSTFCKNCAKKDQVILNDDSIVNMLHGEEYTLYNASLKILYKSIENQIISTALAIGKKIVIDRGLNVTFRGRKRWIALAKSFDVPIEAIVFKNDGPDVHAQRRTNSDSRGYSYEYWLKVANTHNENYQEPTVAEGFDTIHHISFEEIQQGKVIL